MTDQFSFEILFPEDIFFIVLVKHYRNIMLSDSTLYYKHFIIPFIITFIFIYIMPMQVATSKF